MLKRMRQPRRVVITGMGCVTPIGTGREAFWRALQLGTSGVRRIESFDVTDSPIKIAAEARDFDQTLVVIAAPADEYATLLAPATDADFRSDMTTFDGGTTTRGAFIVNLVLCGCAADADWISSKVRVCGSNERRLGADGSSSSPAGGWRVQVAPFQIQVTLLLVSTRTTPPRAWS